MKIELHIEGMTCAHCVRHVTEALETLPGVKKAKVSLPKQTAVVEYDGGATADEMKAAVEEAGYEAALI